MRRSLLVALLLAACVAPSGGPVDACDAGWGDVESRTVTPGGADPRAVPIECLLKVDDRRLRIGFLMPAGPSCYRLSAVEVVEGADAVSITLIASRDDNPAAGACPEEALRTTTEIDLAAPVADRLLLDGSSGE